MPRDWGPRAEELKAEAFAAGQPTAWFDRLYREGVDGRISMPWDRTAPQPDVLTWAERDGLDGDERRRRAVVVGCGLGGDAEYLAGRGFAVTAFDVAPTAVEQAEARHPGTVVDYRVGDLLDLPDAWRRAFDLVLEVFTVQALPDPPRTAALDGVVELVAPGGTLLAVAFRCREGDDPTVGPPFALERHVLDGYVRRGLREVALEEVPGPRWRGEYRRDA